jgi:hypothetical protein
MKTDYQHIRFVEQVCKGKTKIFSCRNKRSGEELGIVKWYPGWRQYCYFPSVQAVYSSGCLIDIANFINVLGALNDKKHF